MDSSQPIPKFEAQDPFRDIPPQADGKGVLTTEQFTLLAELAHRRYGLSLPPKKRFMVSNRLMKLKRLKGFADIDAVLEHYQGSTEREDSLDLFDVLSTNLTHFFREAQHLELLVERVLARAKASGNRRLRIWSAGCSRGCEPYSIAISLLEAIGDLRGWDIRILATDLAVSELEMARRGVFCAEMTRAVPPPIVAKYFDKEPQEGGLRIKESVKKHVTFALLNLLDPWKMRGPFDAIYCRNVMIYFDDPTRGQLTSRFASLLAPDGVLFLGSSESLTGIHADLLRIHPSSYRKVC